MIDNPKRIEEISQWAGWGINDATLEEIVVLCILARRVVEAREECKQELKKCSENGPSIVCEECIVPHPDCFRNNLLKILEGKEK